MSLIVDVLARLRSLLQWRQEDQEMDEEIRFHLDQEIEKNLAAGFEEREARRLAKLRLGGVDQVKERTRDERGVRWIDTMLRELRTASRVQFKRVGLTTLVIATLSVGVGLSTAMFSVVAPVLFWGRPILESESVYAVVQDSGTDASAGAMSYPGFQEFARATQHVFSSLSAIQYVPLEIEVEGAIRGTSGAAVTGNYFALFGLEPEAGRFFGPDDDLQPGAHPVAVLSHNFWKRALDSDPDVVGQQIRLANREYTVVGVAPEGFQTIRIAGPDLFIPMMMLPDLVPYDYLNNRESRGLFVRGRLLPDVTFSEAESAVRAAGARFGEETKLPPSPAVQFSLLPIDDVILSPGVDPVLKAASWMLLMLAGLVLLAAFTNVAGCLLARSADRHKEIALRRALGASRGTIARQLITESVLLGAVGGVIGLALAMASLRILSASGFGGILPLSLDVGVDSTVLAGGMVLSLCLGISLGMISAWTVWNRNFTSQSNPRVRSRVSGGHVPLQQAIVAGQFGVSVVLLIAAGLFLRSLQSMVLVDPGFGQEPAAVLSIMLPPSPRGEAEDQQIVRSLLHSFSSIPGVEAVGITSKLHLSVFSVQTASVRPDGGPLHRRSDYREVDRAVTDAGFFQTTGIEVREGRSFNDNDSDGSPPVAIVSEALARRFWPDGNAVGQILQRSDTETSVQVVGVASDANVRTLGEAPRPVIYLPYAQNFVPFFTAVARTSSDDTRLPRIMAERAREIEPDLIIWQARTMAEHLNMQRLPAQAGAILLSILASVVLGLAAIGLYGALSYAVSRRSQEIGIRMALGASPRALILMLAGGGGRSILLGASLGGLASIPVGRLLGDLLFRVNPVNPHTFIAVLAVIVLTGVIALYVPAFRITRIDPAEALRAR